MQANRGRDTKPEMAVRRLIHANGLRYRVNARPEEDLRRTADIVFTRIKVAVFIDGCFWHGCPTHFTRPRANREFWERKIQHNIERDEETTTVLIQRGWKVLRFWEHESPGDVADTITTTVLDRG